MRYQYAPRPSSVCWSVADRNRAARTSHTALRWILSVLSPPFGRVRSRLGCVYRRLTPEGGWESEVRPKAVSEGSVRKRSWILQAVEQKMCRPKQARGAA
jgi:hypothetical protein